jgi:L-ascorbate metabolism protein UlaG (beta-lactamase superfamily)
MYKNRSEDMPAIGRRQFVAGAVAVGLTGGASGSSSSGASDDIAVWHKETEQVSPEVYRQYMADGGTRGFASLEKLEAAFEKVMREVKDTKVDDIPAVWSVYNMGYVIKTRESLFSIDLVHRRDMEFASMLDFALVTHNHGDHYRKNLCKAIADRKRLVISNFIPVKGYTRAKKTFKIKDVEIRTSLIDHNDWLIDFTTAFEIKVGNWTLYHTGDSGRGTEPKLETVWGRPDLWLFFPGCGIDTAKAVAKVKAKRIVFGHLWELEHKQNHQGRLDEPLLRRALVNAVKGGNRSTSLAFWGERIV